MAEFPKQETFTSILKITWEMHDSLRIFQEMVRFSGIVEEGKELLIFM